MKIKACIKSMRLRTLPLSLSGTVTGIALALTAGRVNWVTVVFLAFTTASLQILSNLSNELGDALHGTDTTERQGVHYSLQDGEMTIDQMKMLIVGVVGICCVCGLIMIETSFNAIIALQPFIFILLGAGAIWAAMKYTLGDRPYGYRGLGDAFVFVFFGMVSTLGAAYICGHRLELCWLLPASAIGLFSIGVLNVNNIRDMKSDSATRVTVAMKMGPRRARIYQTVLIVLGWLMLVSFTLLSKGEALQFIYILVLPLFVKHLTGVWTRSDKGLDPMLPLLVISTFLTSLLFAIGMTI